MVLPTLVTEFRKIKQLAERAIAQVNDEQLHACLDSESNSIAMLMAHMAGNMRSRWTDFLTTDGEKPWRTRDAEFEPPALTREALTASWEAGWQVLFDTLSALSDDDLQRTVTIRGEAQTALTAIVRQVSHYAGHAHQIVLLAKHLAGTGWTVLSIPRGQSAAYAAARPAGRP